MRILLTFLLLVTTAWATPLWSRVGRVPTDAEIQAAAQAFFAENRIPGEEVSMLRLRNPDEPDPVRSAELLLLFTVIDRPSAPYIPPDPPKYFAVQLVGDGTPFEFGLGPSFSSSEQRSAWIEKLFAPNPPVIGHPYDPRPAGGYLRGWGESSRERVEVSLTSRLVQDGVLKLEGNLSGPSPITSALFMRNRGGPLVQGHVQMTRGRFQAECALEPGTSNEFKLTFDQQDGPGAEITLTVEGNQISVAGTTADGQVQTPTGQPPGLPPREPVQGQTDPVLPVPPEPVADPSAPDQPGPGQPTDSAPEQTGPTPAVGVTAPGTASPMPEPGPAPGTGPAVGPGSQGQPEAGPGLQGVGQVPGPADLGQAILGTTLPALITALGSVLWGAVGSSPSSSSSSPSNSSPTPANSASSSSQPEATAGEQTLLGDFTSKLNSLIEQKAQAGYYIKNTSMAAKVWNGFPVLSSTRDWLTGHTGGQCGEADEWGRSWIAEPLRETFGEQALVEPIVIQNSYLPNAVNHISTRVILPSGRRVVACFWDGLGRGKMTLMSEKEWEHVWSQRCSGVLGVLSQGKVRGDHPGLEGPGLDEGVQRREAWREHCRRLGVVDERSDPPTLDPMVIGRSDKENALKECITKAGGDTRKGIEAFLRSRLPSDPVAAQKVQQQRQIWVKSYLQDPW